MFFLKKLSFYYPFARQILFNNFSTATILSRKMAAKSNANASNLVWVDLEMTGLEIEKDQILEIACIVTDSDLNILAEGPDIIIHQSDETLKNMNDWCIQQHGDTGLTEACRKSTIDLQTAEKKILDFVKLYAPQGRCPLAGNSVYMDRLFLLKYMPTLNGYLHYRIIDVSTIKELSKRWYLNQYKNIPTKSFKHRALSDIQESIEELKYYRQNVFKQVK